MSEIVGKIVRISGPVIEAGGMRGSKMYDVVRVCHLVQFNGFGGGRFDRDECRRLIGSVLDHQIGGRHVHRRRHGLNPRIGNPHVLRRAAADAPDHHQYTDKHPQHIGSDPPKNG